MTATVKALTALAEHLSRISESDVESLEEVTIFCGLGLLTSLTTCRAGFFSAPSSFQVASPIKTTGALVAFAPLGIRNTILGYIIHKCDQIDTINSAPQHDAKHRANI